MRLDALDRLNFFLADVRGGSGPFVTVFLFTQAHWSQASIGAVLTVSGLIGIAAHPAVGAFIDGTRAKRGLLVAASFLLCASGLAIIEAPTVLVVIVADIVMATLGAVFAPTVAAITLGMFGREALADRLARNAVFDRAGNIFIAGLVGLVGVSFSQTAPFFLAPVFAVLAAQAAFAIPAASIDHDRARGLEDVDPERRPQPGRLRDLLQYRSLIVYAAAAALFNFANAPTLSLIAQKLASENPGLESGVTSAAIIIAQLSTIAMAFLVARADLIGRKPLLILSFVALTARDLFCVFADTPLRLLAVQLLDGVGGGLFDAMLPLVLADLMRGTGHYSLARGGLGFVQGGGGAISLAAAGFLVTAQGYAASFLTLAVVASAGLALIVVAMPETGPKRAGPGRGLGLRRWWEGLRPRGP
jgi:predicted MFS family arabinose efflux permease